MKKARAGKETAKRERPTELEVSLRQRAFRRLDESRQSVDRTPIPPALDDTAGTNPDADRDLWNEMRLAEEAAEAAAAAEAVAAAARQSECDLFEQQPNLHRNPVAAVEHPAPRPAASLPAQQEPITAQLAATLRDLLDLHDFGEQVVWPCGFDARTAHQRLCAEGKR
jgi:hypothetical protein